MKVPVVSEAGERIRERQAHRAQGAVRRALVERDREKRADQRNREHGRAFPEHHEHHGRRRHEGERNHRRAGVVQDQADVRLPRADGDGGGDQDDVHPRVCGCRYDDTCDERADAVPVDRRDQRAGHERHDREHRDVEGDALERTVLQEMDRSGCDEQQDRSRRPAVQDDCCDREHEGERDDAAAAFRVDRHRKALGERGRADQSSEAEQLTTAVGRRREGGAGRDQDTEARQTNGEDEGG